MICVMTRQPLVPGRRDNVWQELEHVRNIVEASDQALETSR